jgi:hypothetical protein
LLMLLMLLITREWRAVDKCRATSLLPNRTK